MKKYTLLGVFLSFLMVFGVAQAQSNNIGTSTKKGEEMSNAHRSNVANVVEGLRATAGKDVNIGEDLRLVAQEQEAVATRTSDAIKKVETRNKIKTFLIGTDYKNLGAIRSELASTTNNINRLLNARARATDTTVQAELDAEIALLQKANTEVETFVKSNENKFSLFGWFVKLF